MSKYGKPVPDPQATSGQIYHASLSGTFKSEKGTIDDFTAGRLGLKSKTIMESKTWKQYPDPWINIGDNGQTLLTIDTTLITAIRATDTNGHLRCMLTIAEFWTTGWGATKYRDNPGMPFQFSYENKAGGRFRWWDQGRIHSLCGMNKTPINFTENFEPDIYDDFEQWHRYLGQALFYKC
jgi:hypothetical protein